MDYTRLVICIIGLLGCLSITAIAALHALGHEAPQILAYVATGCTTGLTGILVNINPNGIKPIEQTYTLASITPGGDGTVSNKNRQGIDQK